MYTIEEYDKQKTKILKYIFYKKRTEKEIMQKFSSSADENMLEDLIQELKENHYIDDNNYVQRAINEFMAINTLSKREIGYKLYAKGISSDIIDTYFTENEEQLEEYEMECAKKIVLKKQATMDLEEIKNYLKKKGYSSESIKYAFEELN